MRRTAAAGRRAPWSPALRPAPPHLRRCPLDQAQRADEGLGHSLGGGGGGEGGGWGGNCPVAITVRPHSDAKVLQGTLSLGAPVPARAYGGSKVCEGCAPLEVAVQCEGAGACPCLAGRFTRQRAGRD